MSTDYNVQETTSIPEEQHTDPLDFVSVFVQFLQDPVVRNRMSQLISSNEPLRRSIQTLFADAAPSVEDIREDQTGFSAYDDDGERRVVETEPQTASAVMENTFSQAETPYGLGSSAATTSLNPAPSAIEQSERELDSELRRPAGSIDQLDPSVLNEIDDMWLQDIFRQST